MSYAPELFDPSHAEECLTVVEKVLMEKDCMGIKTLDPTDKNYNGDYINSDDSHGWNYHQGPEWVWPVGFFLKAKLRFSNYSSKVEAFK
jgi:glycogen debranching enzyme